MVNLNYCLCKGCFTTLSLFSYPPICIIPRYCSIHCTHFASITTRESEPAPFHYTLRSSFADDHGYESSLARHSSVEMPEPHFTSWNSLIRDSCMSARYEEALSHFSKMQNSGFRPNGDSFPALIKSCAALYAIESGKALHGCVTKEGFNSNEVVTKALINMYAKCGYLFDSERLFHEADSHDTVLWNILMSGYAGSQLYAQVLELFYSMHTCNEEPKPSAVTFAIVLPVCVQLRSLKSGRSLHAYVTKSGLESQTLVGNALLSMYAKCGSVCDEACSMFYSISCKDIVSWNAMVAGYIENGFLQEAFGTFTNMVFEHVEPNYATLANVLPLCATLEDWYHGKEIHSYILRRSSLMRDVSVCNALMTFYSRMGHMEEAKSIFRKMDSRDLVSWNTVIAGSAVNGLLAEALNLFRDLISSGLNPDSITLLSILPVCAQLHDLLQGKRIHEYVLGHCWLANDIAVGNALISFYAKCSDLQNASQTFMMMKKRDLISWNTMLAAYAESRAGEELVELLDQMWKERVRPDHVTILSVIKGCTSFGVRGVRETHSYSIRSGLINETTIGNAIIDMYAKCGTLEQAYKTFKSLVGKNVVTGNAMISGYVKEDCQDGAQMIFNGMSEKDLTTWNLMVQVYAQNDPIDKAISLFDELQHHGFRPDVVSIMSILPVCGRLVSVHLVRQLHGYAIRACFDDICLEAALLDMYSKCGSIRDASKLFQVRSKKDLVIFTAMVGGYATHGMGKEALAMFARMLEQKIRPDHVVMTAVLSACSHAGLVDEGWGYFNSMEEIYGIKPTVEHYSCMVDLLARSGRVKEAYKFISNMPARPNANVWSTFLGACKTHHEVELGRQAANNLFDAEEQNIGNYVVMSNIYAAQGKWDGVEEMRRLMKMKELKKPPGCSWIEVDKKTHIFMADDSCHPQRATLYCWLRTLDKQIKEPLCS